VLDPDDPDESSGGFVVPQAQEIADKRTVQELDQEIERLEKELDNTANSERRQEIEQQIANNENWRGKLVNKRGQLRPMVSPGAELARKRVRRLLDRARLEVTEHMPAFARYLAITEHALKYDPTRAVS
jgi:hypothetical protein